MDQPTSARALNPLQLSNSFSHRLSVAARRVARYLAAQYESKCDINTLEWRALAIIAEQGDPSATTIGVAARMEKVLVSRATGALVNRGLLKRIADSNDGRVYHFSLTRKGIAAHAAATQLTRELEAALSAAMSDADLSALWKGLKLLEEIADKLAVEGE